MLHLLLVLQDIIDGDADLSRWLRLIVVENYDVSAAQLLIPACDVSEQISLASKEGSGTGGMKLMLNGAVTLGTDDGVGAEIHELVGGDNCYLFGINASEAIAHQREHDYRPGELYASSDVVRSTVDFITSDEVMARGHEQRLWRLREELIQHDPYMTLLDLEAYIAARDRVFADYEERRRWQEMMLINIASAGFFSSDRMIREYEQDIWQLGEG